MEVVKRDTGPPGVNSRSAAATRTAADLEVLRNIEHVYFSSPREWDATRYVLESAPAEVAHIEQVFTDLKRQQQVVSSKALHLISQQRDNCDREFREIQTIRDTLADTLASCRQAREHIRSANDKLTLNRLTILANYKRRQIAKSVLKSLQLLRVLRDVDKEVGEKLAERDYEGAISLILKCRKAAAKNKEYKCMETLSVKLQDTLELTEEKLDSVLAGLCHNFEEETFSRLRRAYAMLGKLQAAMEQLHMHYISAINENATEAVKSFTRVNADKFQDLCLNVPQTKAPGCLLSLCENLFSVMRSYHLLVEWNTKHDDEDLGTDVAEFEKNVSKEYIRQKLKTGLIRIWHDVQAKVSTFLKCTGLEDYPFEKFIQMLGILRQLTLVAEVFCDDKADMLQDFMKTQGVAYIKNYHSGRMEELRLFLENEGWEQCPVRSNFTLINLQEFKPLKKILTFRSDMSVVSSRTFSDGNSSAHSQDGSVYIAKYFSPECKSTPFEMFRSGNVTNDDIFGLEPDNDVATDESEDEPEELKKDYVDETTSDYHSIDAVKTKQSPIRTNDENVIVTNTTLSVLRHCGQYLQICRYLKPIALEIIMLMFQLFDYYFYTVHNFFTADLELSSSTLYTAKLNATLKRIANNIDGKAVTRTENPESTHFERVEETLHGLSERIVGVESVIFLGKQFRIIFPYLETIVSPHQRVILEYFRDNTLAASTDLRNPVYMCSASKSVDARSVLISLSHINFNIKSVVSEHSGYVDTIVRQLQVFALRLDNVAAKVTINKEITNSVWSMVSKYVVHMLVEGFSNASKCTNAGRGLMQLDYTQLLMKFEKICGLKPLPYQEYVEKYVKAYYLPRGSLEEFIRESNDYSDKHLVALISCACENKRDRQELMAVIESRTSK